LVIYADAVLPFSVSLQCFEVIARQDAQISQSDGRFQTVQLKTRRPFDAREGFDPFALREISGPLVAVAKDHNLV